jgi:hypothetical protein
VKPRTVLGRFWGGNIDTVAGSTPEPTSAIKIQEMNDGIAHISTWAKMSKLRRGVWTRLNQSEGSDGVVSIPNVTVWANRYGTTSILKQSVFFRDAHPTRDLFLN